MVRLTDGSQLMWIVIHQDSHFGVEVHLYDDIGNAIRKAQYIVQDYRSEDHEVEVGLTTSMIHAGWVYYADYSPETGTVHVVEKKVLSA